MKIKYFHQLIFSHLSTLIIAFILLWVLFSSFIQNLIYDNKVEELNAFAGQIMKDLSEPSMTTEFMITNYNKLLKARSIQLFIFNAEGEIVGKKFQRPPLVKLTEQEWNEIKSGNNVSVKQDLKRFNEEVTLVATPYIEKGTFYGGVLLVSPISNSKNLIQQINQYLYVTASVALVITFLLSWTISKYHERRIQTMRKATSLIAVGDYDVNVPVKQLDEIGELANDFNHMAKRLRESKEEIERLERRRRQFIADVSHELRTPLTTMSGLMEGLLNNMIPESEKERSIVLVSKETQRLIRLVNENLDFERIRSNQITLNIMELHLQDVFEIVKDQLTNFAQQKNNDIIIEVEKSLSVNADYDRLVQILLNITKNSVQFTAKGTIWLRGYAGDNEIIIEIKDNGIGMDVSEIKNIWKRFYKADLSRTNQSYGEFGLGLSIVKQLVLLHNGEIEVESVKEKGTLFTIRLPL